jgi:hypothetical protein
MAEEKRIDITLIRAAKYNRKFYKVGEVISILPSELDSLIEDGVISRDDVPDKVQKAVKE